MTTSWPRAVVFDLDGTLVDSTADIARAANVALAPTGIHASDAEVRGWLGDGARALIEKALQDYGLAREPAYVGALTQAFVAAYEACPVQHTTPFPGVYEALDDLNSNGIGVAVCTNKPETVARQVLSATGLEQRVAVLAGGGVHALKPDPAGLQACITALATTNLQTVYVGDQAVDVTTARRAGVLVIAAAFGYARVAPSELGADVVLHAWPDLTDCLARLVERKPT